MKILISTIFQDAGDATRALRMAEIIRKYSTQKEQLDIAFISRGSKFEDLVLQNNFRLIHASPKIQHANFHDEFQTKFGDLIGNIEIAKKLFQGEIEVYEKEKPDVILNGFFPISTIARRLTLKDTVGVSFLPLPLVESFVNEIDFIPEEIFLSYIPNKIQKFLLKHIPAKLKKLNPAIKHHTISLAARKLGVSEPLKNIFDMLKSDFYFVNDYSRFYKKTYYPDNLIFTGPLIPNFENVEITNENIIKIISPQNKSPKIFCSLGSVGEKKHLYEIIKMFNSEEGKKYSGIVLAPKEICPIDEIKSMLKNKNVYVTDQFIPAKKVNELVDLVICHGGQGTLQTAIQSATPIIGVAMQPEQQMNLHHLEEYGVAIQVKRRNWKCNTILKSIKEILSVDTYRNKAIELKTLSEKTNTEKIIGETFWNIIVKIKNKDI